MHRVRVLFPILLLALAVASCEGGGEGKALSGGAPGVTDEEILIGSSLALGGHAGYLGTQTLHGALSYLGHVNDKGGVYGRKIRVIALDDEYDPPRCLVNTQNLIVEEKVFALFCYVGTPTTLKVLPLVETAEIPLLGMFTGAQALREPFNRCLFNVRVSYYEETGTAVKHLVEHLNIRKVAVFYQYDAYGFDGLRGTEMAMQRYGLAPVARGNYVRGTLNVEEGLEKIMSSGAEAVIMIGTYAPSAKFIKLAAAARYEPVFYAVSFAGPEELARRLGEEGEGMIMTQVVPPPGQPESLGLDGIQEYSRLLRTYYPQDEPNFVSFEGYINAKVLVEGLKRAGKNLTRLRFIEALESLQNFDPGVSDTLSFGPADHQGLERVYLTRIKNGRFALISDREKTR